QEVAPTAAPGEKPQRPKGRLNRMETPLTQTNSDTILPLTRIVKEMNGNDYRNCLTSETAAYSCSGHIISS
ncbi:hypothetical protein, partial [Rufibacter roseus]